MAKEMNLKKVIVITGASSGFGKGTALSLADQGALLVLAARRKDLLEDLAEECVKIGSDRAIAVQTDVSEPDEVRLLVEGALEAFGRIDVWINDAGVTAVGKFERIPIEVHEQVIRTDLFGTLYGSYYAYQQFLKQGNGILINIASELGITSVPFYTSYTAAKHGIVGLSESLRQEVKESNLKDIHICHIMPASYDTPFFDHAANYTGHEIQAPKPLHDPDDVIETIVRLVNDPEDKDIVGADGLVKIIMKKILPPLEEKIMSRQMEKMQFEEAPTAIDTAGAVNNPVPQGTDVSAGRRAAH